MTTTPGIELEAPRMESHSPMLLAGLSQRYEGNAAEGIPGQWGRFAARWSEVARQIGETAFGACYNTDAQNNFDYLCGVEVADAAGLPVDFATLQVPGGRFAVFAHRGHVSGIRDTFAAIWGKWVPQSGEKISQAPILEAYGPEFNPQTGMGGFEIWIPLEG